MLIKIMRVIKNFLIIDEVTCDNRSVCIPFYQIVIDDITPIIKNHNQYCYFLNYNR